MLARRVLPPGSARAVATAAALALAPLLLLAGALGACKQRGGAGAGGGTGEGGSPACQSAPEATFTLRVQAEGGPLPRDTTVHVAWSAGEEPRFALDDPTTWKTLDEANLVCAVDRAKPPPAALPELVCQLWTAGAARVRVTARGYQEYEQTFTPAMDEECDSFLPQEVDIQLVREADGGVD